MWNVGKGKEKGKADSAIRRREILNVKSRNSTQNPHRFNGN